MCYQLHLCRLVIQDDKKEILEDSVNSSKSKLRTLNVLALCKWCVCKLLNTEKNET